MKLNDPNTITFDGTPVTGRVPPKLRVEGGRELTQQQAGAVMHAYKLFRDAARLSVTDFQVQNRTLLDGTRVRMESLQDQDTVYVWPAGDGGEIKMPHGFAVVTNWRKPKIFKRGTAGAWTFAPDAVPQLAQTDTSTFDNQAFRKPDGKPWLNLPMVFRKTTKSLWDYARRGALTTAATFVAAFRIKNATTGEFTPFPAHYAADSKVYDKAGTALYTMADAPGILGPLAIDYPEPVKYWPAQTDASGNELALQHWRYAVISPTFNIWQFRLCNERLRRIGDTTYEALERNEQDVTTPWDKQTVTVTNISDGALGEDPGDLLQATWMALGAVGGVGAVGGSGYLPDLGITTSWCTGWGEGPVDLSTITMHSTYLSAMRQITTQGTGSATLSKIAAVGKHLDVGHIDVLQEVNYPATVLWRGGEARLGYHRSDIFGSSFSGSGYGVEAATIKRKDTKYYIDGEPKVTAKLGWKDLMLLEGTTTGRMDGRVYENVETIYGKFDHATYGFITRETYQSGNPAGAGYVANAVLGAWLTAHDIRWTYFEDLRLEWHDVAHGGPNPTTRYTTVENVRPTNTVEYALTSRYVIDYDHKGRFYAAIRCEVVCGGAQWDENIAVYEGYMTETTAPTYTVKIYFESCWDGLTASQLLVEETVSRPGWEIITIPKFSPWYWPFPAYIDRDCKVRVPPEPTPDENFMMMFNNLTSHQGVNTNLACADVRPDITGADIALTQSQAGIEYSELNGGRVIPHTRYVTGQLYARTFKLSDIPEALWMLKQLKFDAVEDNFQPPDPAPVRPAWHYHPLLKAALDVDRHIEVRDGVIGNWSDELPGETSGYPPTAAPPPADRTTRDIKLYRV